ncbi:hypothetical protein [Salinicoccus sp. CNSTN-B1]
MKLNIPKKYILLYTLMSMMGVAAFVLFGHNLSLVLEEIVIERKLQLLKG